MARVFLDPVLLSRFKSICSNMQADGLTELERFTGPCHTFLSLSQAIAPPRGKLRRHVPQKNCIDKWGGHSLRRSRSLQIVNDTEAVLPSLNTVPLLVWNFVCLHRNQCSPSLAITVFRPRLKEHLFREPCGKAAVRPQSRPEQL